MLSASLLLAAIACTCLGFFFTCCCTTCTICTDNFDRTDGTDIDTGSLCGWTEDSGSWDINSNKLRCTSAGIAVNDTTHPDGDSTMIVEVDFTETTAGATVDVIAGYVDNTHFFYVRYNVVAAGATTIELRYKNGGSDTQLDSRTLSSPTILTSTTYTAKICVGPNGFIAGYLNGTCHVNSTPQTVTGTQCALRSSSGTTTFDNLTFSKSYQSTDAPTCTKCLPKCDTGSCLAGTTPNGGWQSVIASGNYAGTYLCDQWQGPSGGSGDCIWIGTASGGSGSCIRNQSKVTVVFHGGLLFDIGDTSTGASTHWRTTDGIVTGRDCTSTFDCSPNGNDFRCAAIGTAHASVSPLS